MSSPALNSSSWTPIGPAPIKTGGGLINISGRVEAIAPHPTDASLLFAGADGGGLWQTTNATGSSVTWTPLTDSQPSLNFQGYHPVVIHPANPNLILGVVSAPGAGILQSPDGGNSWNFLAQTHFEGQALLSISVHPTDTGILYVAAGWNGASKSTDGGATWKPISALPGGYVFDLIVSPEGPDVLYAGVVCNTGKHPKNGIYKSTDAGTSWQAVNTGLPPPQALTHTGAAIRLEPGGGSSDPVVYAAVLQNTAGRPFVWLSPGPFGDQQHFTYTDTAGTVWDTAYGGPFSAWSLRQINAGGLTDAPAAASPPFVCLFGAQQHVAYYDSKGTLWDAWFDGSATWSWQQITGNGGLTAGLAAAGEPFVWVSQDGQELHFTYRDINGAISDAWYDSGSQKWNLRSVNAGGLTTGPAAAGNPFVCLFGGEQHVAWYDSSGAIWDAWSDNGGPWSVRQINLESAGGLTKGPAAAGGPFVWAVTTDLIPIQLHFTYQSADGTIWDSWYNAPHYAWNLQKINDGGLTNAPAAAAAPFVCVLGTEQHVGYVDGSGNIWDASYDGIASWSKRQINNRAMTKGPGALHGPFAWVSGQQLHFTYQDTGLSIWDASVDTNTQWNLMQVRGTVQRYLTTNGGAQWNPLAWTPQTAETRSWHLLFGVDPQNASHVFANDSYCIFESTDSGATWSRADSGIGFRTFINPFDWVNIAFDAGDNVILTADQGVLKYSPANAAGQQWSSLMGNLEVSEFYTVSLDPSNASAAYAIGQDISAQRYSGDPVWNIMDSGISETGKILVDPNDSSLLYAFNPLAPGNLVMRSKDGGNTWNGIHSTGDFASNDYAQAYAVQYSFAMAGSSRLLFGTTKVFETQNRAAANPQWSAVSQVLSQSSKASDQYILALAIGSSDDIIYAATGDGHVWATYGNGAHWKECDSGFYGTAKGPIVAMRAHPTIQDHAFAITGGGVWWMVPGSPDPAWSDVSGNFPKLKASSLYVDCTQNPPALYVGTLRGVYRSLDRGNTWNTFGTGLPNVWVRDLHGAKIQNQLTLAAATFGRGVWEILL